MEKVEFEYAAYIAAPPEKIWNALFDRELTGKYWQHENVSDWRPGSKWEHRRTGGSNALDLAGTVVESVPSKRLVLTWAFPGEETDERKTSRVRIEIEPFRGVSRVTVVHDRLEPGSEMLEGITEGWPKVISSLKSLLETGRALPVLWEMPVEEGVTAR